MRPEGEPAPDPAPVRVGPYRLGPELGRGANGIVFEATDEKLGRKVALKVLSDEVASTPEQRARFAREARLLAAVSHPNVALVYGVVEEEGRVWLALEHLGGETLADALARGPLPVEEALDAARQIADGLEAAHESGVVHRDLKPANVEREPDGTVKVLDFGLAKPAREASLGSSALTSEGLALGTPLYMSPEQLRGRPVDRRADVWALGCVLWELLTGRRAFEGASLADVVHAVLERDPDTALLPARTPRRVRELLGRCLQKDPRRRLRDAGDARLELEAALAEREWLAGPPRGSTPGRPRRAAWGLGGALAAAAALLLGWTLGRSTAEAPPERARVLRLVLSAPPGRPPRTYPRLTPLGNALVHEVARGVRPEDRYLVLRRLDAFEEVPIPGTERVETYAFAPNGERLALVRVSEGSASRYELSLVHMEGSEPPTFLGTLPAALSDDGAMGWLDDGTVVLATRPRNLLLVHTDGSGRMKEVPVVCDESLWPHAPEVLQAIPGTRQVLASAFQIGPRGAFYCIVAIDADTGDQELLVERSKYAICLPGRLLYSRADVLFAAPFDAGSLALTGDPIPVASGLRTDSVWESGSFHASSDGSVAWWPGGVRGVRRSIYWVEPDGRVAPWSDDRLALGLFLEVDATGGFLTAVVVGASGAFELWGSDVAVPRLRPLLADPAHDYPGGVVSLARRELYYCRFGREGSEVRRASLDRPDEGELLHRDPTEGSTMMAPTLVDGGRLLTVQAFLSEESRLIAFELAGEPPLEPRILWSGPRTTRPRLSPDGEWLALSGPDAAPTVRRVGPGGSMGPPWSVPTGALGLPAAWWGPGPELRLHLMPPDDRSVHEVLVSEQGGRVEMSEPRLLVQLDGLEFFDAAPAGHDRYLAILEEASAALPDRVHLMVGGLPPLRGE